MGSFLHEMTDGWTKLWQSYSPFAEIGLRNGQVDPHSGQRYIRGVRLVGPMEFHYIGPVEFHCMGFPL